jgi:Nif-specific regulatory protein/two-component system response regulator HydG
LKVIELILPPLRDRKGDVPLLVEHFVQTYWKRPGPRPRWTSSAEQALVQHSYPGNVRELAHAVERACILARSAELDVDLLPPEMAGTMPVTLPPPSFGKLTAESLEAARQAAVARVEREFVSNLMRRHGDNISAAARHSGLNRTYLQKLLARHKSSRS